MRPRNEVGGHSHIPNFLSRIELTMVDHLPFFEMVFTGLCAAEDETINTLQLCADPYNLDVDLHSSRLFSLLNGKSIRSNLIPDL